MIPCTHHIVLSLLPGSPHIMTCFRGEGPDTTYQTGPWLLPSFSFPPKAVACSQALHIPVLVSVVRGPNTTYQGGPWLLPSPLPLPPKAVIWDIRHCSLVRRLRGHRGVVFAVDLDHTSTQAFTGSGDRVGA